MDIRNYQGDLTEITAKLHEVFEYDAIAEYLKTAYNVGADNNDIDLYGKPVKDYDNVDTHYLSLYSLEKGDVCTVDSFKELVSIGKALPGVNKIQMVFIGPNSLVPWHKDGMHMTDEERERISKCNILIPACVPKGTTELVGVQLEDTILDVQDTIVFESKHPHYAWNKSSEWWVILICYTQRGFINE